MAAGVIVLVGRDAVVQLFLTLLGAYLVYEGVAAILRVIHREPAPKRGATGARPPPPRAGRGRGRGDRDRDRGLHRRRGHHDRRPARPGCNGHQELCDTTIDELVLPATHNSMAVPLPGWFAAEQDAPIADQLRDGVRGLLIDTHYGDKLPDGRVRTEIGSASKLRQLQEGEDGVSPQAVDAALRIRDRLVGSGPGKRGMYLCHTFCEIGATPLAPVLDDLRDFLVANPDEFVTVINEDYVKPADFTKAVEDAGLGDLVYRGPVSGEWPTLREAIDRGWRVLFLAENEAGAQPWYHPAFKSIVEDTPYTFPSARQLTDPDGLAKTCEPNRGPEGAPLFLVNHWVSTDPTPRPSDATKVNAREPLLRRMRECERVRDHLPNLVAVNFYRRGDVFGVVDELNGVR